jgi:hypothetical protein
MNGQLLRMKGVSFVKRYYPNICLEGLRKAMKHLIHSYFRIVSAQATHHTPLEYISGALLLEQTGLVICYTEIKCYLYLLKLFLFLTSEGHYHVQ